MEIQNNRNSIRLNIVELFLFIFTMIFIGEIKGVDIRIGVDLFWLLYSLIKRVRSVVFFTKEQILELFFLLAILVYVGAVFIFSDEISTFYFLKIFRCLVSSIVIFTFFNNTDVDLIRASKAYIIATSVHVFAVLGSFLSPQLREYVYLFSGYSKKYLPFRSSGLFSGYDYAGFFINIAIFILGIFIIKKISTHVFSYFLLILFMISVLMTSRFNSVILILIIFLLLGISLKSSNQFSKIFLSTLTIFISIIGGIFMIISMNILPMIRYIIVNRFPSLDYLSTTIINSYANYNVSDTISSQYTLPKGMAMVFGENLRAPVDPGYINSIYYIGVIGLILILSFYTYLVILSVSRTNAQFSTIVIFMYIITVVFEMKLSFLFSSGAFEVFVIFWCITDINKKKIDNLGIVREKIIENVIK